MSSKWRWEYDPDHANVAGGVPKHVVAEVERLAGQLVELAEVGVEISDAAFIDISRMRQLLHDDGVETTAAICKLDETDMAGRVLEQCTPQCG